MKTLLFIFLSLVFASCNGNGTSPNSDTSSVKTDTSFSGAVVTDSTGASRMNADTTGMKNAR